MARRRIDLTASAKATPPTPASTPGKRSLSWIYIAVITGLTVAAFLIWLFLPTFLAPATAPPTVASSPGGAQPTPPTRSGVITSTTTVAQLLDDLAIADKIRERLLTNPALKAYGTAYAGHRYEIEYVTEQRKTARALKYEADDETYVTLTFRPYAKVSVDRNLTDYIERTYAGLITENIWHDILESPDLHHTLIPLLEEATKYTVDIFHLDPGDRYELAFTERRRGEKILGVDRLNAVVIKKLVEGGKAYPRVPLG